jgi:hypothetical protein
VKSLSTNVLDEVARHVYNASLPLQGWWWAGYLIGGSCPMDGMDDAGVGIGAM